jgi:hypothetical protein
MTSASKLRFGRIRLDYWRRQTELSFDHRDKYRSFVPPQPRPLLSEVGVAPRVVVQLEDERSASHDALAAGKEVAPHDGLKHGGLSHGLPTDK